MAENREDAVDVLDEDGPIEAGEPEGLDTEALERREEALAKVLKFGDPVLRSKASPVTDFDGDPTRLQVIWIDERGERVLRFSDIELDLAFEAHPGWKGRIERPRRSGLSQVG